MTEQEPLGTEKQKLNTWILQEVSVSEPEAVDLVGSLPSSSITPGTLLIHTYQVERLLASGGMGEVYLAQHVGLHTWHAIKVIRPALFSNQQVLDLFRREATVLRGVGHGAVVSYDGFFRDEKGRDYLVMEYVKGPSLADRLQQEPLSLQETFVLRNRLAEGLSEAHQKGAVHRDISPDNVILENGRVERAKLIDFGVCKLTDPTQQTIVGSAFIGKFPYASPEQLGLYRGEVDARSDIYSLGLLLAAAAIGRHLDMGDSLESVIRSRKSVPDLTSVPEPLREQITAMLQPDPADRPRDLAEVMHRWPVLNVDDKTRCLDRRAIAHAGIESEEVIGAGGRLARSWLWPSVAAITLTAIVVGGYTILRSPALDTDLTDKEGGAVDSDPQQTFHPLAAQPWREIAPHFHKWVTQGETNRAFALLQEMIGLGRTVPSGETFSLAQKLRSDGRLDDSFALLQTLATGGDGPSALILGEMYDPLFWSREASPFSRPNPRKAKVWYQGAADRGVASANDRLKRLEEWKLDGGGNGDDVR